MGNRSHNEGEKSLGWELRALGCPFSTSFIKSSNSYLLSICCVPGTGWTLLGDTFVYNIDAFRDGEYE